MNVDKSPEAYRAEQAHEAQVRARAHQAALRQRQARTLLEAYRRQEAETWPPLAVYEAAVRHTEPVWYLAGR
jgi:hypothetical protein